MRRTTSGRTEEGTGGFLGGGGVRSVGAGGRFGGGGAGGGGRGGRRRAGAVSLWVGSWDRLVLASGSGVWGQAVLGARRAVPSRWGVCRARAGGGRDARSTAAGPGAGRGVCGHQILRTI